MAKNYKPKMFRNRYMVSYGDNIRFAKMSNRFINQVLNDQIIVPNGIIIDPTSANITIPSVGEVTRTFSATVLPVGANQSVTWTLLTPMSGISLSNNGVLTVLPTATEGIITISATSIENESITTSIDINLTEIQATDIEFTINPLNVRIGASRQFAASVIPSNADQTIIWSIKDNNIGVEIDQNGMVSVSQDANVSEVVTVVATSEATPTVTKEVTFTVIIPEIETITIDPTSKEIIIPTTETISSQFEVALTPDKVDDRITWSLNPSHNGVTLSDSGLLSVSPTAQAGNFEVVATSVFDDTKVASASITLVLPSPNSVSVTPQTISLDQPTTGSVTRQLNATVSPTNAIQTVNWTIEPSVAGTSISNTGLLTIGSTTPIGTVNVVATSTIDPSKKDTATATVNIPLPTAVISTPNTVSLIQPTTGTITHQFNATVEPTNAIQTVTWSVNPTTTGTSISSTGLLTIDSTTPIGTFKVVSTSTEVNTINSESTVTLNAPNAVSVEVSPEDVSLIQPTTGTITQQFTANVSPSNADQTVNWTIIPTVAGASISSTGLLTISSTTPIDTFEVSAVSSVNDQVVKLVNVNVVKPNPTSVVVTPTTLSLEIPTEGTLTQTLNKTVSPTNADQGVVWSITPITNGVSVSNDGIVTIDTTATASTFDVIAKSSVLNTIEGKSTITLTEPIPTVIQPTEITLTPTSAVIDITDNSNKTQQFNATVIPAEADQTVTWSLDNSYNGVSIDSNGLLTVMNTAISGIFNVIATSTINNSIVKSAEVEIIAGGDVE